MGANCTYRQVGQSFMMPHYDWQRAVQEFGIKPGDRVLDVGGGDMPFERADVVTDAFLSESHHRGGRPIRNDKQYVECRVEQMPFVDKEFDFVYCNHVLEHTDDPIAACRELIRVAKRGYIEVPCYWAEYVFSDTVHYWMIDWVDGSLVFRSKPYRQATREDTPFKGVVHKYWAENRQDFLQDWQVRHRNLWTIQILWDGDGFGCRVETLPAEALFDSPAGDPSETGSNAFGQVYPTLCEADLHETLGIQSDDRVLDVRMTGRPHARANAVADLALGDRLAFDGQAFDFAYCSDLLYLEDPGRVCEELMRVAKRGFIELPHAWASMMLGDPAQRWLVEVTDGVLTFRRRRYLDHPFRNILRAEYHADPDFRHRFDVQYRNVSHVQFEWSGSFAYRVLDEGGEFDYDRQAALSHFHFARHDRAQGVPLRLVPPNLMKALELDPGLLEAQAELESALDEIRQSLVPSVAEAPGISAVVHTLNEESRLEDALKSLQGWVDEIIVVDMHSSDATLEIARRYTDRIYFHDRIRDFDAARNVGAALARHEWVFYLDADERVPAPMGRALRDLIMSQGDRFVAVQLPYKNHFAGKWIQHAGQWWPGYKAPMLLRKGTFWWDGRMHHGARIEGMFVKFPSDDPDYGIVHHSYETVSQLVAKQNRYTDAEASYKQQDGATFHWKQAVAGFVRDFQTYYDRANGQADGPHGFLLSFFAGFYQFATQAKLFEGRFKAGQLTAEEREVPASMEEVLEYALQVVRGTAATEAQAPAPRLSRFDEAVQDLMDYLQVGADEIERRIKLCSAELRAAWLEHSPSTASEMRDFYGSVDGYLYGLTNFNYIPSYVTWREAMVRLCQGIAAEAPLDILDYGAGIGTNLLDLTRMVRARGTHADVPGRNFDYAAWRYRRHGAPVDMLAITGDAPLGDRTFDVIVCVDVLEHLPDPEAAVRYLIDHLRPGGILIATVWFVPEHPDDDGIIHLNTDKYTNASFWKLVDSMGVEKVEGDEQFRVYRKPRPASLLWQAPIFDPSGYADEARNFLLGLDSLGADVKAFPLNWSPRIAPLSEDEAARLHAMTARELSGDFVNLIHIFPPYFSRHPQAIRNIGRTMFETDRIPADWVAKCNEMDEVWVPSDFNLETFAAAGVDKSKLVKVPGSLDPTRYGTDIEPMEVEGKRGYNFLSLFDWSLRKGWDVLIRAFVEEFRADEDVALILKVYSTSGLSIEDIQERVLEYVTTTLGKDPERIPDIVFLDATMSDEAMLRLYKAADAYVMPSRGEGWGRPLMEAMAMGLPTIGTGWSGNTEFMHRDNSYLIDYELHEVSEEACREAQTFRGHRWAEPSLAHLKRLMRNVFTDRSAARAVGERARAEVLAKYDRRVVARTILDHLEATRHDAPVQGVWEGGQFIHHSLAYVNRELELALLETGQVELSILQTEPAQFDESADPRFVQLKQRMGRPLSRAADFHLRHQFPPSFEPPPEGHWIMIQPWEFGGLPEAWVGPMTHAVDELWVPTRWVRDCYLQSGIPADKVHVIPNGIDVERFVPKGPRAELATKKSFKLLFVGGTIMRKGIDLLLAAYLKAFKASDDVCLVIKDFCANSVYSESNLGRMIQEAQANPDTPEILYLNVDMSGDELAALYRACDVLVHPYRGEGFGLPIAEAMASGLPVIVPKYGACLDFCDDQTAILLEPRIVPLPSIEGMPPCDIGYWLAEIPVDDLAAALVEARQHPERLAALGQKASERIRGAFTWPHAAKKALERLQALRSKPILRKAPDFVDPRFYHPGVAPLAIDGRQATNFLALPEWQGPGWLDLLKAYLEAFRAGDPVALVLRVDPAGPVSVEQAQDKLLEAIAQLGHDPEQIPDLLLVDSPLTKEREGGLFTACQALLSTGGIADRKAAACGLPVLAPMPEALRAFLPRAVHD